MNIVKYWNTLNLGVKFTVTLTLVIIIFLSALGVVVVTSRKINQVKVTEERMHAHVQDLYAMLELSNRAQLVEKLKGIKYYENGYPVLIDLKGNIIFHPNLGGQNISGSGLYARMAQQKNGKLQYKWPETGQNRENRQLYFKFYEPGELFVAASIDEDEAINKPIAGVRRLVLISIFLGVIFLVIVMRFLLDGIVKPINLIAQILQKLSLGSQANRYEYKRKDEIGNISESLNRLIDGLKETARFANEIEKKNFDYPFTPLSNDDVLGNALIDMRESLKKAAEEDEKRKAEDFKTNWATEGLAKFSEILRLDNDNLEKLSSTIITNLVKYLKVNQGGLFILNDDNKESLYLQLTGCYAYDREKYLNKVIEPGEGITGTCFLERETIYLREIPDDYINITSGLGEANPSYLLLVPLKLNEKVYGVLELASFNDLKDYEIRFVEKIAESIASTLSAVKTNMRTAQLLEQSQQQAEEMRAQEEEMRQNMEELHATQESMELKRQEQEQLRQELDSESSLLRALLESSEDTIYFKDKDSKFIRVSNSLLKVWGMKTHDEAMGLSDFDMTTYEEAKPKYDAEQEIIRTGKPLKIEERDLSKKGTIRYISTVKMPLADQSGKTVGTFGISRDISDIRNTLDSAKLTQEELKQKIEDIRTLRIELEKCQSKLQSKK